MKKQLYLISILANAAVSYSQTPFDFQMQPAIEVDANFYKLTLELKEGKDDDDYKQKDKIDLPITIFFNNHYITGLYTGSCIKIKVSYTDSKKTQSDKLYLPNGKGRFTRSTLSYDGDWQFGSFNGEGRAQWGNNNKYEGNFVMGEFAGKGSFEQSSDVRLEGNVSYEGEFSHSKPNGKGKMIYANGNYYDGNWQNNVRSNGYGVMIFKDGSIQDFEKGNRLNASAIYEGNWINELFDGYGKLTYPSGSKYEGNWKTGKKNGKGKLTKANGGIFDGSFNMGLFTGRAKQIYENGDIYVGDFIDDKKQGNGSYTFKSGEFYNGQWANNKYNGKGKYIFKNGDSYEGDFVNDIWQGNGTYTHFTETNHFDENGDTIYDIIDTYTGQWANGKYNGKGSMSWGQIKNYTGDFVDGQKHGVGTESAIAGITYTGQWANDLYNGKGEWSDENVGIGEHKGTYIGNFVNGKKQGNGIMTYVNGGSYNGQWANDLYNGKGKLILPNKKIQEGDYVNGYFQKSLELKSVKIGAQTWTTKNLDVSTYRNGDVIPQVQDEKDWIELSTGAWCYYGFQDANGTTYGKLYNWDAVNDARGLAPIGYHIPTDAEWTKLINYLGGEKIAGKKMKSTSGWNNMVGRGIRIDKGTNSSGFSGLPGGGIFCCDSNGNVRFESIGYTGAWWSSTVDEENEYNAWSRHLECYDGGIGGNPERTRNQKPSGLSVRLIKD